MASGAADAALLADLLDGLVPVAAFEVASWPPERLQAEAERLGGGIACGTDTFEHGRHRRGERGKSLAALARAVAIGARVPGGTDFLGRHWCTDHAACLAAETSRG